MSGLVEVFGSMDGGSGVGWYDAGGPEVHYNVCCTIEEL